MSENNKNNLELLKEQVINVIKTIYDPEIPVNIWELGLIYDIQITENNEVVVLMTLTAPNCPEAEGLPAEVEENIKMIPEVKNAKVLLTFDPPWDKSRLSDLARFELGLY
ncbi:MAG: iron-sulfur cluster assembly protein [Candidatus Kapabacteria bacterium]|nr:iron-sulfur cluster assembly protein [Candidatus Kapabacteria bacterium]